MAVKQSLSIVSFAIFNKQRQLQYTTISFLSTENMLFLCECHTVFIGEETQIDSSTSYIINVTA